MEKLLLLLLSFMIMASSPALEPQMYVVGDRLRWAEAQLRRASAQRGLDWDRLSEDERESFVDTLLHEK